MSALKIAKGYVPYHSSTPVYANGSHHKLADDIVVTQKETLYQAAERLGLSHNFFSAMPKTNKPYFEKLGNGDIVAGYEKFLLIASENRAKISKIRVTLSKFKAARRFSIFAGIKYADLEQGLKRWSKKIQTISAVERTTYIIDEYKKFKDIL